MIIQSLILIFFSIIIFSSVAVKKRTVKLPVYISDWRDANLPNKKLLSKKKRLNVYLNTARSPIYKLKWRYDAWQKGDFFFVTDDSIDEVMLLRNRGGSKSRDGTMLAVWFGYQKRPIIDYVNDQTYGYDWNRVLWYAASENQIIQAHQYFMENRYVDRVKSTRNKIVLWNGNTILLKIMTEKQAASARSDIIFFDEEQDMELRIYQIALGTMVGGNPKKIHMGTTLMDTVLENNFKRLDVLGLVLEHHIDECSWTTAEKEINSTYAGAPKEVIQSQLYCKWVRPGGLVFENVEIGICNGPFSQNVYWGVDPNPKTGHALVGVKYTLNNEIYVFKEFPPMSNSADFVEILCSLLDHNALMEVEAQGEGNELMKRFNDTYIYEEDYYGYIDLLNWNEDNKAQRVFDVRTYKIIIHPDCLEAAHHIRVASWDSKNPKAKLKKTSEAHFLDAFLHACQAGTNVEMGIY